MKLTVKINLIHVLIAVAVTGVIIAAWGAGFAQAQEPGDITLPPLSESGKYPMNVEIPTQDLNDAAVFEACCDRVDVDPAIPLGCSPREGAEQVISFSVDIVKTPGDNAEVRCYTVNVEDRSDYSHNKYYISFPLRPNAPNLQ